MRYTTKSALIGRKRGTDEDKEHSVRPCFISLFKKNNPHLDESGPDKVLEFEKIHKILFKGLDINYLLPGNDILLNDLDYIDVEQEGQHLMITGKQQRK
ncbi:hypothetical protein HY643_03150 [Candidatus Woesearchaeota archaeon]|nr:hypothetical protein [Candidatus Woesearchaeota archaeon]